MFTWNFQFISKARLAEAFDQLKLDASKGDILIRIHTAIHLEEEAVDLARFLSELVPGAHIFGTSTSAAIFWGKLVQNQCVISVTQMSHGKIRSAMLPAFDENGIPVPPQELCRNIMDAAVSEQTKLLLTFLTADYLDIYSFIDCCNEEMPDVQMIGGIPNCSGLALGRAQEAGFVFNENGWTNRGIIAASFSGENLECCSGCATGAQPIGEESVITDSFGTCVLTMDGEDAAGDFLLGIGDMLKEKPVLADLFPYVFSDTGEIPVVMHYSDDKSLNDLFGAESPCNAELYAAHPDIDTETKRRLISATHYVPSGSTLRRAFIYDRKIIADNRVLFRQIENFEKAETLFGYSCISRARLYAGCVKWEISIYENTNICGCITDGEIVHKNGRNHFANCTFAVAAFGEENGVQDYNPYVFSYTDSLADDNQELLEYLCEVERQLSHNQHNTAAEELRAFVRDCEMKLLYSGQAEIPNAAAMNMDISIKGYDRVCMINIFETSSMETVFNKHMIDITHQNYVSTCVRYAKQKEYAIYSVSKWHLAICAPSYMVSLSEFVSDMEALQHELFAAAEEYIALIPMFCVLDDCTVENIMPAYYSARVEMSQRNVQFCVRDAKTEQLDEESIRERYHMVNVIHYAVSHDKVIPYFQGIYDNREHCIHHYESLMRLEDEKGKIYYPGNFLPVARAYGLLYDSISVMMIKKVFEKFKDIEDKSVSINVSIRDIRNPQITDYINDFLSTAKHPEHFVFEILENEDIDDYDEMVRFVDRIHELGAKVSIDDFGSGFSNLQHIAGINSDFLKIDGSIVRRCCEDKQSANLIALIAGWKQLSLHNVSIVAEYVENEEIQKTLLEFNIDYSQGYLFSKPSPDI